MVTCMGDKKIRSLDDVRAFLAGSTVVEFSITDKAERYRWVERTRGGDECSVVLLWGACQRLFAPYCAPPTSTVRGRIWT